MRAPCTLKSSRFSTHRSLVSARIDHLLPRGLGVSQAKKIDWKGVFNKGRNVNTLSFARFFLFASRDAWFEIGLPLFLRLELGWRGEVVGLVLAGECILYVSVYYTKHESL